MAKTKTPKKKPYRSLASNMLWSTKKQIQYAPMLLIMLIVQTPINVALAYADIYLPSLVVSEVTTKQTISHAAHSIGVVMILMLVGRLMQNAISVLKQDKIGVHGSLFSCIPRFQAACYDIRTECSRR